MGRTGARDLCKVAVVDADHLGRSSTSSVFQPITHHFCSLVSDRNKFDMVYVSGWMAQKVCQGRPIFRDESRWVATG